MLGAPILVTPPEGDVITADQAMGYLRIEGEAFEGEVDMLVATAIGELQDLTGVRLLDQRVSVTADCFGDLSHFRVGPIQEVVSIAYLDAAGVEQTVAPEGYELFGAPLEQGVRPAFGECWPSTAARAGSIIVTLDVGYGPAAADVPEPLRFAAFAMLRGMFEGAEPDVTRLIANHRILG